MKLDSFESSDKSRRALVPSGNIAVVMTDGEFDATIKSMLELANNLGLNSIGGRQLVGTIRRLVELKSYTKYI